MRDGGSILVRLSERHSKESRAPRFALGQKQLIRLGVRIRRPRFTPAEPEPNLPIAGVVALFNLTEAEITK